MKTTKPYPSKRTKKARTTTTATSTSTNTDAPDDREDDVEVDRPSSIASDVPARRDWQSSRDKYNRKVAGETASATAPSSLAPPEVPTRERGFGLGGFQGKFSSSATEEKEEERADSQPGAFRVDDTSEWTLSETGDAERVTALPPVPELPQFRENTQGQYLAEANLVLEPDLVFGEPLEDPTPYWSQPKVRRRALLVFLAVVGVVAGVGVGVGVGVRGGVPDTTVGIANGFDCSNTTVGCLYTGTQSLGFQDPDSFLVANCTDTNFEFPTNENCDCQVNVPTSPFGNPENCQSCSFVNSADGDWRLAYDCSNLLSGDCVGRDISNTCISRVRFNTTSELREAVDAYLVNNSTGTAVARTYGWPIGIWDVSKIQDFSYLFSAYKSFFSERLNPAAASFNEDISGWRVSSATTMTSMFAGAISFDQPLEDWDVSSVTDMSFMFSRAIFFDQPLGDWNVSSVTDTSNMFYAAISFNQPLANWDVSSVRDMSYMFSYANSFDESFAGWDISSGTDVNGMFIGADGVIDVQVQVQYDNWPSETGWTLQDSSGTLVSSQPTGSFTTKGGTVNETSSVALGTYTFVMTDTYEDGICCNYGSGSFIIAINGETVVRNDGRFLNIVQETFEVQAPTISRFLFFETTSELRRAVDDYLADNSTDTVVARAYGWPIGVWDVSNIQDFGFLFSADEDAGSERFNPAASSFNEDISGWDVSSATTMASMFAVARSFDQPLAGWDVSSVTDTSRMFSYADSFDQPLMDWDVSSVTDMSLMFYSAISFYQPLTNWDISSVRDMSFMFSYANSFDASFANWNVSSDTDVSGRFTGFAFVVTVQEQHENLPNETEWMLRDFSGTLISKSTRSFNTTGNTITRTFPVFALGKYTFEICCQNGTGSFSITVDGETVISINGEFGDIVEETFELLLPNPERDAVLETREQLRAAVDLYLISSSDDTLVARTYGWPIGVWDVSRIQDFSYLFSAFVVDGSDRFNPAAATFNEDISGWSLASATTMRYMFARAASFDQPLGDWNVSSVTDMYGMFARATSFNQPLADWNVASVSDARFMFSRAISFDQPLGEWNVSSVTDMFGMFASATSFNQVLADWNVSRVTDMSGMFYSAESFNRPLAEWDVSGVTDMYGMFQAASSFDQPIGNWDVSNVADMHSMFEGAASFDQQLLKWDVSSVNDVHGMFYGASSFNRPLGNWNVSRVTDMSFLFDQARSFDQPIGNWNVSSVTSMYSMFREALSFNQTLTEWDVSSVTKMVSMFREASSFDQPLAKWDVSSVTDMRLMFQNATSFNRPLAGWDVSSVSSMRYMFRYATSFDQDLGNWSLMSETDLSDIFTGSRCPGAEGEESCFFYEYSPSSSPSASLSPSAAPSAGPSAGPSSSPSLSAAPSAVLSAGPSSSASPIAFTVEVQVQVQYDRFPYETGWTLRDSTATSISSQSTGSFTTEGGTVTNTYLVALGTYTFEMTDTAENGICCGFGSGSFSIVVDGETVVSNNGQFGNIVQETFEVRAPIISRFLFFETREELREAVDLYLADNSMDTSVASTYGWPIGVWDVSKIQDFSYLFAASDFDGSERFNPAVATFNEEISGWNLSSATTTAFMFYGAASFDQPIGDWNLSSVTNMRSMFYNAASFNQSLADWNVSSVANTPTMFYEASSFNQPLADWNLSSVTNMRFMFAYATSFNHPLADWNLSSVTDVGGMFNRATSFNQPLADWNVSSVMDMSFMFAFATSFNQSLGNWNVSKVTDMNGMFRFATSFNQPLGNWDVSSEADLTDIFGNSGCAGAVGEESCFYII
jgi:surface protein